MKLFSFKIKDFQRVLAVFLMLSLTSCGITNVGYSVNLLDYENLNKTTHEISQKIVEISGLQIAVDNDFYGFNDSGGEPELYRFNPKKENQIIQTIRLKNADNYDWENMAENDSLIFIGDTGNNAGNRKNLRIYYIKKEDVAPTKSYQEVESDTISFFYPEQKDFSVQLHNHNFDMEAMFYLNGKLHLFTKEWESLKTRHFTLSLIDGKQAAWLVESYNTQFLVTGADAYKLKNGDTKIAWVGYTRKGQVYLMVTTVKKGKETFFDKPMNLYKIGFSGKVGQVEGVAFKNEKEVCYSAEEFKRKIFHAKQNVTCITLK